MLIKKQNQKIVFEPRIFVSRTKGDVLTNGSLLYSEVDGNAGVNASLGYARVSGNAGVNVSGLIAEVDGNAGVNVSGLVAEVVESHDYTIGDITPKITKYLPKCIREINLPAINSGAFTNTEDPYNSFILGVFNKIKDTGNDYIAFGLLNRITDAANRETRYSLICSGRVHIDGFFTHRNKKDLDAKVKE